jgi:hypothetical protein
MLKPIVGCNASGRKKRRREGGGREEVEEVLVTDCFFGFPSA